MKHLIYAVVAASALGFTTGAFACGAHTASTESSIVVAQSQLPPATQSSTQQDTATQSK